MLRCEARKDRGAERIYCRYVSTEGRSATKQMGVFK